MPNTLNPATEADRVRHYTPAEVLQRIEEDIERNVAYYATQPDEVIAERIDELKREWSINRQMQMNVSSIGLLGSLLAFAGKRRWALLPAAAFGFLLCHGLTGWAPVVPPLRRRGLRTGGEIDREIYALKVARGDFKEPPPRSLESSTEIKRILQAVNA